MAKNKNQADLDITFEDGKYKVTDGITIFLIPPELIEQLKKVYKAGIPVIQWYYNLYQEDKNKIIWNNKNNNDKLQIF